MRKISIFFLALGLMGGGVVAVLWSGTETPAAPVGQNIDDLSLQELLPLERQSISAFESQATTVMPVVGFSALCLAISLLTGIASLFVGRRSEGPPAAARDSIGPAGG